MFRADLYACVSTNNQQTIPLPFAPCRNTRPEGLDHRPAGEGVR